MFFLRKFPIPMVVLAFTMGVLVSLFLSNYLLDSDFNDLKLSNLIDTFINVFIILLAGTYFTKMAENQQRKTSYIIEQLSAIENTLKEVDNLNLKYKKTPTGNLSSQIRSSLKYISQAISRINKLFPQNNSTSEIEDAFFKYKKAITGGNFGSAQYTPSSQTSWQQQKAFDTFNSEISNLICSQFS